MGFSVGVIFSLIPLFGPLAGFLNLVSFKNSYGVLAIFAQILIFGYMIMYHPFYRKSWTVIISIMGTLLWCLSGFFYLYALAT